MPRPRIENIPPDSLAGMDQQIRDIKAYIVSGVVILSLLGSLAKIEYDASQLRAKQDAYELRHRGEITPKEIRQFNEWLGTTFFSSGK